MCNSHFAEWLGNYGQGYNTACAYSFKKIFMNGFFRFFRYIVYVVKLHWFHRENTEYLVYLFVIVSKGSLGEFELYLLLPVPRLLWLLLSSLFYGLNKYNRFREVSVREDICNFLTSPCPRAITLLR